jgi:two-component sensor histidine kinase
MQKQFDILAFRLDLDWSAKLRDPAVLHLLHLPDDGISPRGLWARVDPAARLAYGQQIRRLGSGATRLAMLLPVRGDDGLERQVFVRARVRRDEHGRHFEGVLADLTTELRPHDLALAESEERANLAVRELNHRVRNIMSVVTALITLSARFATDVESFSMATLARIQALNIAYSNTGIDPSQPHLIRSVVEMADLAAGVLAGFGASSGSIVLSGASLRLSPGQASAMGLILHELASNALQHGKLGHGGSAELSWVYRGSQFDVRWEEPMNEGEDPSFVDGFGMTIVKMFARNYLNGDARWTHQGDRLVVTITGLEG